MLVEVLCRKFQVQVASLEAKYHSSGSSYVISGSNVSELTGERLDEVYANEVAC